MTLTKSNQMFLVNAFPPKPLDIATYGVEDTWQHFVFVLDLRSRSKSKVKGEIMYFLVNASPPKPLDVATSNFADAWVRTKAWYLRWCTMD